MATQRCAGACAGVVRRASLSNGGVVGLVKAINAGLGMVLDGSDRAARTIESAVLGDVMGGVARRIWARNPNSIETSVAYDKNYAGKGHITLPMIPDEDLVNAAVEKALKK